MKPTLVTATVLAAFLAVGLLPAIGARAAEEAPGPGPVQLAQAHDAFAIDLYGQLKDAKGNLFFSPYSISTAMTMTWVGAKGETAGEMAKTLHLLDEFRMKSDGPGLVEQVLGATARQKDLMQPKKDGLQLNIANSLWGKDKYPFNKDFIKTIKDSFGGNLEPVNFSDEPAARKKINDWVADQTKDKIKDLIGKGMLNEQTRLVLVNAIYFKAAWAEQFQKGATAKGKFHVTADKDVDAEMMSQTHSYALAEIDGGKMLVMPYKANQASMMILLPDKVDGLSAIEKALTAEKLTEWREKAKSARVALKMPKFKSTCSFNLNKPLVALGMKLAFTAGQADFSGIANVPDEPLYIGFVVHKAFVDVNEEGTEAAAATAVAMRTTAIMIGEPVPFVADHPFIYIIQDNATKDILFMGRLNDPTEKGE